MKAFVVAILAVLPLACLAKLGPLNFKAFYYKAEGSDDKCDKVPDQLEEQWGGNELSIFDCAGKKAGSEACYCMSANINGKSLGFRNMCGKCGLSFVPDEGHEGNFQFWGFVDVSINIVGKLLNNVEITKDDLNVHGSTHNVNIPTTAPKKMMLYSLLLHQLVSGAQGMTDEQTQMLLGKMDEAFKLYMGIGAEKGKKVLQVIGGLNKVVPKALEMVGCNNVDVNSESFMAKLKKVMPKLVVASLLMKSDQ